MITKQERDTAKQKRENANTQTLHDPAFRAAYHKAFGQDAAPTRRQASRWNRQMGRAFTEGR